MFAFFIAYAVLRYHLFKGEPWSRLPFWTLNKAVAMTSVTLLALALIQGVRRRGPGLASGAAALGRLGFFLALGHTIASLALLNPAEFPSFFTAAGGLTLSTGVSMAAGAAAYLVFWHLDRNSGSESAAGSRRAYVRLALLLTAVHAGGIGWYVWIAPSTWPGRLIPLTLIAAVIAVGAWLASYLGGRAGGGERGPGGGA